MTRFLYSIFLVIGISSNLYAENKAIYLPHTITASSMNYVIEYDSLNRIIKEDIVVLKNTIPIRLYTNSFSYNEDGLIKQKRSISYSTPEDKQQEKPEDDSIDYYFYTHSDSLITANVERNYKILRHENILLTDKQSILFYLDRTNKVYKTIEKSLGMTTITEIGYDSSENIETSKQSYIIPDKDYTFQITTKVMASDKQNGIFKNVYFSPIQRTLQVNNFFLFFAGENPTYVISESNTNEDSEEKTLQEKIELRYSYNEAGYPTSIVCKSSKEDEPEEFKIEYLILNK